VRKGDMLSDERLLASNKEFSPSELTGIVDKLWINSRWGGSFWSHEAAAGPLLLPIQGLRVPPPSTLKRN
jgi:hypothetical protein